MIDPLGPLSEYPYQKDPFLWDVMGYFKFKSAKEINAIRGTPHFKVWQPSFHDERLYNSQELIRIRKYIRNNPRDWERTHA